MSREQTRAGQTQASHRPLWAIRCPHCFPYLLQGCPSCPVLARTSAYNGVVFRLLCHFQFLWRKPTLVTLLDLAV